MNLIEKAKELREMEQKATQGTWVAIEGRESEFVVVSNPNHWIFKGPSDYPPSQTNDALLISALRNTASALLEVLDCFREGDAMILAEVICLVQESDAGTDWQDAVDCLTRLQSAAKLMEDDK